MKKRRLEEEKIYSEEDFKDLENVDDLPEYDDSDPDEQFEQIELEERGRLYARRKKKERTRQQRTWKDHVTTGVLVIAVCVLIFSLFKLGGIFMEYHKGEKEYEDIQKTAVKPQKKEDGKETVTIDFAALKVKNADTAAWIMFEEPSVINYPVVHCADNETYLTKTFDASDNKLGALFIEAENKPDFSDRNTIIYGHNMKNKTMFAELMEYKEKGYWKEHPYFTIYTPDGKETRYQIYAAGVVNDTAPDYQISFASDEDFQDYIYKTIQSSAYATGVEVTAASKLVTLSTCTNVWDEERFVVHAVAVETKDAAAPEEDGTPDASNAEGTAPQTDGDAADSAQQ